MSDSAQITVTELAKVLAESPPDIQLVDVRERIEVSLASLPGFQIFPLSEFEQWSGQINQRLRPELETLVLCHHGIRSSQMCQWLISQGFTNVKNILGGIDAYASVVDRTVPRY
jgi:rhodanese-related sulfurtransferase